MRPDRSRRACVSSFPITKTSAESWDRFTNNNCMVPPCLRELQLPEPRFDPFRFHRHISHLMSRARKIEPAPKPFAWRMAIALFALTVITYIPSMTNGFIWDDPQYVVDNPTLKIGRRGLWNGSGPIRRPSIPQYYPMVHTTFWIEAQLLGHRCMRPAITSTTSSCTPWRPCCCGGRWFCNRDRPGRCFAAAVFALHPVMVESVTWVTERKNVLVAGLLSARVSRLFPQRIDLDLPQAPGVHPGLPERRWYIALARFLFCSRIVQQDRDLLAARRDCC